MGFSCRLPGEREPHSHIVDSSGLLEPKLTFNSLNDCERASPMEALISDAMAGTMMCLAVDMSKSRVRKAGSAATLPPPASIVTNSKVIPPGAVALIQRLPNERGEFDAFYGAGSAAASLKMPPVTLDQFNAYYGAGNAPEHLRHAASCRKTKPQRELGAHATAAPVATRNGAPTVLLISEHSFGRPHQP